MVHDQSYPFIRSRLWKSAIRLRVLAKLIGIALWQLKSIGKARQAIHHLKLRYQRIFGEVPVNKVAYVNGRYFWRLTAPGFPSRAHTLLFENELNKSYPYRKQSGLRTLFLAITKKCPLNCEHCFEWNNLNKQESLTLNELQQIIGKYQAYGTSQIMLSGGEPLVRYKDLLAILENSSPGTDFWVITSGFRLAEEKANALKKAGLTGIIISMDHHLEEAHNRFRGFDQAYYWATHAAIHARNAGLVTALSLCATRSYVSEANLTAYMEMAKKLGVTFVQFLEPRASGRYFGKDVALLPEQIAILERFYINYNTRSEWAHYPIISFVGYLQRRSGCFGGGNQYLYINTGGGVQVCPFCSGKTVSALGLPVQDVLDHLASQSCKPFVMSKD